MTEPNPVLIEQTGKKYKKMRLIGGLVLLTAVVLVFVGIALDSPFLAVLSLIGASIGAGYSCVGSFLSWWHHG